MSTDRELLELAAKATGYTFENGVLKNPRTDFEYDGWNPLTDDGDALRLAVKLCISIEINGRGVVASWVDGGYETKDVYEYPDSIQDDDFDIAFVNYKKATRRAIVRAAAAIAKDGGAA